MRTLRHMRGLAICAVLFLAQLVAQTQSDSAGLIRQLSSGTVQERLAAVANIREIPSTARSHELIAAMAKELERLNRELEKRKLDAAAGQTLEPWEYQGEYLFNLLDLLAQQNDPQLADVLMPFIDTGNRVMNAIVSFGDLAVGKVIVVARGDGLPSDSQVSSALMVLNRMLGSADTVTYPLTEVSKQQIVDVARQHLTGNRAPAVVLRAIELGAATDDQDVLQRIRTISSDVGALREMGIDDPSIVARIQQTAKQALAAKEKD